MKVKHPLGVLQSIVPNGLYHNVNLRIKAMKGKLHLYFTILRFVAPLWKGKNDGMA